MVAAPGLAVPSGRARSLTRTLTWRHRSSGAFSGQVTAQTLEAGPLADQLQHAHIVRIVGGQPFGVPCDQVLQKARDDRMLQLAGRHLGKMPLCGEMDGGNELERS